MPPTLDAIVYHVLLCEEAGFLTLTNDRGRIGRLTWAGHEKLEELRKEHPGPIKKVDLS